jgi:hypothetical protein
MSFYDNQLTKLTELMAQVKHLKKQKAREEAEKA